uniref:Uncharacterized protein n=1 Tax=Arundo donax TaxID=35708 RepID=A0A0A8Z145_ARUDO
MQPKQTHGFCSIVNYQESRVKPHQHIRLLHLCQEQIKSTRIHISENSLAKVVWQSVINGVPRYVILE